LCFLTIKSRKINPFSFFRRKCAIRPTHTAMHNSQIVRVMPKTREERNTVRNGMDEEGEKTKGLSEAREGRGEEGQSNWQIRCELIL